MRAINDILRDVILQLESIGGAPRWPWEDFGSKSPLGLYMSSPTGDPQTPVLWSPDLDVDTGTLIDAAQRRGCTIATLTEQGKTMVEVKHYCLRSQTWSHDPREAVILALAKALGVDTEE